MKFILVLFSVHLGLSFSLNAQIYLNLVNNPSFEDTFPCPVWEYGLDTIGCPRSAGKVCKAHYWFNPLSCTSPDYYNTCYNTYTLVFENVGVPKNMYGFQWPRTGNAYVGLALYAHYTFVPTPPDVCEYVKNKLKDTLSPNKEYCVTFYVSLANNFRFACNKLGVLFDKDSLFFGPNCTSIPPIVVYIDTPAFEENSIITDTLNWVPIQGIYRAKGGEKFLAIGRFTPYANVSYLCVKPPCNFYNDGLDYAYYYIDDVSVIEISPAKASNSPTYTICPGETVVLGGDTTEDAQYYWYPPNALSCTNCAYPRASPTITTTYYLQKTQCKMTTKDSVTVFVRDNNYFSIPDSIQVCAGDTFYLYLPNDSVLHYSWSPNTYISCTPCDTTMFYPIHNTQYILQTRFCNQTKFDTLNIKTNECNTYSVPNIFTPNGDGINDTWGINFKYPHLVENFYLVILDRWGVKMFVSDQSNARWDGRTISGEPVPTGTYYYTAEFKINNKKEKLKGYITLMK
ncbi:MAG: hypothetical protein OHK0036_06910 [Bacteroidia bacterium]